MDASIILAGRQPDFVNVLDTSNTAAQRQNVFQQQNALTAFNQANGAAMLAGDKNALAGYAGFDPQGAMNMQTTLADAGRLSRDEQQQIADHAATLSQAERDAKAAQIETTVRMGMMVPDAATWDAQMAQTNPDLVGQFGNRNALAARYMSMAEVMKASAPPESPKPADDYQRYVQEENTAGRKPLTRLEFVASSRGPSVGFSTTTTTDGATTTTYGQGVGTSNDPNKIALDPRNVDTVVSSIDDIIDDPNLNGVVGPIEGTGGNNVDEFSAVRNIAYGGPGLALIQKINQLQNTTWLSARQMLKGGGAVTDFESKKAEGAMARLSRVQDEVSFRAALTDLKSAIQDGQAKLLAAQANGGAGNPDLDPYKDQPPIDFSKYTTDQLGQTDMNKMSLANQAAMSAQFTALGVNP